MASLAARSSSLKFNKIAYLLYKYHLSLLLSFPYGTLVPPTLMPSILIYKLNTA
jgi:hypothetical protein